jgi:hypothetical protein
MMRMIASSHGFFELENAGREARNSNFPGSMHTKGLGNDSQMQERPAKLKNREELWEFGMGWMEQSKG